MKKLGKKLKGENSQNVLLKNSFNGLTHYEYYQRLRRKKVYCCISNLMIYLFLKITYKAITKMVIPINKNVSLLPANSNILSNLL